MKVFNKIWPLIFILIIWFIFASPYFVRGQVPYPSKYQVNFVPPWSYYEKFWGPVKNNAMPDIIGQIYPWRYFSINQWKSGQIPYWNPYSFAGNPNIANYQSAVFSPFNLMFFIFSFVDVWSLIVLLQPLLAGIFMYYLMKEFKVSSMSSVISSVAFMFSGFMVVWMAYGTLSLAISFLPLSLLAIEKNFNKIKFLWFLVLSLSLPLSFFSGHFQTSLYFFIFTIIFFIVKSIHIKDKKKIVLIFLSILLGFVISLIQIFPSIELYKYAVRSEIFIDKGIGIPFYYLITIFAPDFFGNPVTRNDWFGYYAEWSSFIGIIPFFLSFFAIMGKKKVLSMFFFIAGIAFLLLSVESPIIKLIGLLKVPVLSTSNPTRIIVLFSFSFAVLAGMGLDILKELIKDRKIKKILTHFFGFGLIIISIWVFLLFIKVLPIEKLIIAKRNLFLPTMIFFSFFLIVLVNLKFKIKQGLIFLSITLILFTSFDSLRFVQKWMPFDLKELVFPSIPITTQLKKNIGYGRYLGNLGDQVDSYYGLSSIEGYDPLYIQRFGEFIQSANKGEFTDAERSVVKLSRRGLYTNRVLDILGVNLIFHPRADTNQTWAYPVWEDNKRFSLIYQDDKFQLFRNNLALPRATLFYNFEVITDKKKAISRFYSDDFDFRNKLILEDKVDALKQGIGTAQIVKYTPNLVQIKVETNTPALLFLSDNYYPGWKVKVNNVKTKIYRADYSFRAVIVPKGGSIVDFTYDWFSKILTR